MQSKPTTSSMRGLVSRWKWKLKNQLSRAKSALRKPIALTMLALAAIAGFVAFQNGMFKKTADAVSGIVSAEECRKGYLTVKNAQGKYERVRDARGKLRRC